VRRPFASPQKCDRNWWLHDELGRYHSAHLTVAVPKVMDAEVSGVFPTDDLALALQIIRHPADPPVPNR
jgi:hypothetical protein